MKYIAVIAVLLSLWPLAAHAQISAEASAWHKRCEGDRCEIVQRLMDQQSQSRVLEMAIGFPVGEKGARGVIILPLGVDMSQPFTLAIDEGTPAAFKVRYCLSDGCYGFMALSPDMLARMKKGQLGTISFHTFDGQPGRLPLSLDGFTAGISSLN